MQIVAVGKSNVARDVRLYRDGGMAALLKSGRGYKPTSELAQCESVIRESTGTAADANDFEALPANSGSYGAYSVRHLGCSIFGNASG